MLQGLSTMRADTCWKIGTLMIASGAIAAISVAPAPAALGNPAAEKERTLFVSVFDGKRQAVPSLHQQDFSIFEDDQPQRILSASYEDVPISLGIVLDNSGSMREKRQAVTYAMGRLIQGSNPRDEIFVINFNDEFYLDQDFTSDPKLLRDAIDRLDSRGSTALYGAVIASADHIIKHARNQKRILLVITDGEDNRSSASLEQAIRAVQDEQGPMIYTIGILGHEKERRATRALQTLALETGGVAFFPPSLEDLDAIAGQIALDARNQYSIHYKSLSGSKEGTYHRLRVVARSRAYPDLVTRAQSGYFEAQPTR